MLWTSNLNILSSLYLSSASQLKLGCFMADLPIFGSCYALWPLCCGCCHSLCNGITPYVMITLYVCLTICLLVVLKGVPEYNKCMHIYTSEHHLPLSSDWLVLASMEDVLIRCLASVCTTCYLLLHLTRTN